MGSFTLLRGAALLAVLGGSILAQKPVLTEDFESGKIDPAVWDVRQKGGETIAVEPVEGAHGKYALHVHYSENERGAYAFIVATHLPDSVRSHYFGRAYMKISPTAPPKSHAPFRECQGAAIDLKKWHFDRVIADGLPRRANHCGGR